MEMLDDFAAIAFKSLNIAQPGIRCRFNYRLHSCNLFIDSTFLNIRLVTRLVWIYRIIIYAGYYRFPFCTFVDSLIVRGSQSPCCTLHILYCTHTINFKMSLVLHTIVWIRTGDVMVCCMI